VPILNKLCLLFGIMIPWLGRNVAQRVAASALAASRRWSQGVAVRSRWNSDGWSVLYFADRHGETQGLSRQGRGGASDNGHSTYYPRPSSRNQQAVSKTKREGIVTITIFASRAIDQFCA
jgi:hypothetical protein